MYTEYITVYPPLYSPAHIGYILEEGTNVIQILKFIFYFGSMPIFLFLLPTGFNEKLSSYYCLRGGHVPPLIPPSLLGGGTNAMARAIWKVSVRYSNEIQYS